LNRRYVVDGFVVPVVKGAAGGADGDEFTVNIQFIMVIRRNMDNEPGRFIGEFDTFPKIINAIGRTPVEGVIQGNPLGVPAPVIS